MAATRLDAETKAIIAKLKSFAGRSLPRAHTMPKEVYTSQAFHNLERSRIFEREWLCVGRAESLPKAGDFLTYRIGHQPIVVIRQKDGSLSAFSNVCRHRMMRLLDGKGSCRRIVCPYHAWTYEIDGRLIAAKHMDKTARFDMADHSLPPVRLEVWNGWIYVTLNNRAAPVARKLAALDTVIGDYHAGDYVEVDRQEHVWNTNWKLLTENFMEGYHLPVTHRKTVGVYFPVEDTRFADGKADPNFTFQWFTKTEDAPVGTAHPKNKTLKGDMRRTSVLGSVYPCHMFVLAPDHLWYLSLHPLGTDQVHILYGLAFAPELMAETKTLKSRIAEAKAYLDETNAEDRFVVEGLCEGVKAPLAEPGPLSWLEKENLDFTRYILRRVSR